MMPSPFPGFDPFIESQTDWSSFHADFIVDIKRMLLRTLPPGFDARTEVHVPVVLPDTRQNGTQRTNARRPDVAVFRSLSTAPERGGAAILERPAVATSPARITQPGYLELETTRQRYLEIVDRRSGDQLIAVIELLSPTNKDGGDGSRDYRRRQQQFLNSDVHFMEIDLLRGGEDVTIPTRRVVARKNGT